MHDIVKFPHRDKSDSRLKTCASCGDAFIPRKLWHAYCSPRCRLQAFRHKADGASETHGGMSGPSGAGKKIAVRSSPIAEVPANTHAFHPQNQHVRAPRHVIGTEVFGSRAWRQVTSPDDVVCWVGTLRKRALRDGGAS